MTGPNLTGVFGRQARAKLNCIINHAKPPCCSCTVRDDQMASCGTQSVACLQSGMAEGYDYSRANKESGEQPFFLIDCSSRTGHTEGVCRDRSAVL